jgi:hypothetical protein
VQNGRRARKARVDEFTIRLLCDFRLDGFAEKQARQKPFEQFLLTFRYKVDTQTASI